MQANRVYGLVWVRWLTPCFSCLPVESLSTLFNPGAAATATLIGGAEVSKQYKEITAWHLGDALSVSVETVDLIMAFPQALISYVLCSHIKISFPVLPLLF